MDRDELSRLQRLVEGVPGFSPEEAAHWARCELDQCSRCDAYDRWKEREHPAHDRWKERERLRRLLAPWEETMRRLADG